MTQTRLIENVFLAATQSSGRDLGRPPGAAGSGDTRVSYIPPVEDGVETGRKLSLVGGLLFAGRFTEQFFVWEWVGERRPAAGAVVRQFVVARETLDAAGGPSGADLVPRRTGGAQRPPRAGLEPGGPGGAEGPARAGSVPGQLGGSQRPPPPARLPRGLALLLAVFRGLLAAFQAGELPGGAGVGPVDFLSLAQHGLVALGG